MEDLERLIRDKYALYSTVLSGRRRARMLAARILDRVVRSSPIEVFLSILQTEAKVLGGYDAMAGSYNEYYRELLAKDSEDLVLFDGRYQRASRLLTYQRFVDGMVATLDAQALDGQSLLEVGAGELSSLVAILQRTRTRFGSISAMDVSWSRIAEGRRHARELGIKVDGLFVGSAVDLPFPDGAFDVVMTCHCVEQIPLNTDRVLSELLRVARRYVVLFEPGYEFGDTLQRRLIRRRPYSHDLVRRLERLGAQVVDKHLIPYALSPFNPTGAYVARPAVTRVDPGAPASPCCPACRQPLRRSESYFFCAGCGACYPELDGIPMLRKDNRILATHYERYTSGR